MSVMPDTPTPTPMHRRPVFWVIAVVVLLAVAAVAVAVTLGLSNQFNAASPSPAESSAPATPEAVATAEPTAGAAPQETPPAVLTNVIPATCDGIYTHDLTDSFGGLVLNPAWGEEPGQMRIGSDDEIAAGVLATATVLTCKWGSPAGPNDRGLVTNIAAIDVPMQASMPARLASLGQNCYEELGGTRCVIESPPSNDGNGGESHFFRDGIWIATKWVNAGPDGYTHDIVTALFG